MFNTYAHKEPREKHVEILMEVISEWRVYRQVSLFYIVVDCLESRLANCGLQATCSRWPVLYTI